MMNPSELPIKKRRRVAMDRLDSVVGQMKKACKGASARPTVHAQDILSMDSSDIIRLCASQDIAISYQDVKSIKEDVAAATLLPAQAKAVLCEWPISLPDLLPPPSLHLLPRHIFFGTPELDALFPSLPHPSFLELLETKQEVSYPGDVVRVSHQVAMSLAIASAARGAKVLLLDTGIGTEMEQLLMNKCTAFCQMQRCASDSTIEQLLERVTVQRCYDPFSLLAALAPLLSLPLQAQPDVVILMDWVKLCLPFMTGLDILQHRQQFGEFGVGTGSSSSKEGRNSGSQASVRPLLAEAVLSLQRLTVPRSVPADGIDHSDTLERKASSVVILNAPLHHGSATSSPLSQSPFGYLLTDVVDYSVLLGARGRAQQQRDDEVYRQEKGGRLEISMSRLLGSAVQCSAGESISGPPYTCAAACHVLHITSHHPTSHLLDVVHE